MSKRCHKKRSKCRDEQEDDERGRSKCDDCPKKKDKSECSPCQKKIECSPCQKKVECSPCQKKVDCGPCGRKETPCDQKCPPLKCEVVCKPPQLCCTAVAEIDLPLTTTTSDIVITEAPVGGTIGPITVTLPFPVPLTDFTGFPADLDIITEDFPIVPALEFAGIEAVCDGKIVVGGRLTKTVTFAGLTGVVGFPTDPLTLTVPFQCVISDPCIKACDPYRVVSDCKSADICPVFTCLEFQTDPFTSVTTLHFHEKDLIDICVEKIVDCPTGCTPACDSVSPSTITLTTATSTVGIPIGIIMGGVTTEDVTVTVPFTAFVPPNTAVIIRGSCLYPLAVGGVRFGDVCADILEACSPNLLVVEVPPIPLTGSTTVTIPAGTSVPGTFPITADLTDLTPTITIDNGCGNTATCPGITIGGTVMVAVTLVPSGIVPSPP